MAWPAAAAVPLRDGPVKALGMEKEMPKPGPRSAPRRESHKETCCAHFAAADKKTNPWYSIASLSAGEISSPIKTIRIVLAAPSFEETGPPDAY
jgi:hypothetical protein